MGQWTYTRILPTRRRQEIGEHVASFLVLDFFCSLFLTNVASKLVNYHIRCTACTLDDPKMLNLKNFVAGNECCERLAYYGMSTNLVNYLQQRFGQGNATAANNVTTWSGTCYVTPLFGAFLADAYMGRYWTIATFSIVYAIVSSV